MWMLLVVVQTVASVLLWGQPVGTPTNSPEQVLRTAAEVRLTPSVVAAIGLDGEEAAELVTTLRESTTLAESVEAARSAERSAQDTLRNIAVGRRLRPAGIPHAEQAAAASTLATSRAQLGAARDQAAGSLFQAFGSEPSEFARAAANRPAGTRLPSLWVVPRDAPSSRALQLALIAERRAARQGRPVPGSCQAVLASARSDYRVVAAQTRASQNTAAVAAAMAGLGQP